MFSPLDYFRGFISILAEVFPNLVNAETKVLLDFQYGLRIQSKAFICVWIFILK